MADDILTGPMPMLLGENWYDLEVETGSKFRWVCNDAAISVACFHPYDCRLSLDIEPGPGFEGEPLRLALMTKAHTKLATFEILSREIVRAVIPNIEPAMHNLVLHARGGGKSIPDDDRVLNFRVFDIDARFIRPDVVPAGVGIRVGAGWYLLEHFGNEVFRWVKNDAEIEVADSQTQSLSFDIEAGPGTDFKPFVLRAIEAKTRSVLAEKTIDGRDSFTIPLDAVVERPATISLVIDGGGRMLLSDARTLNFRVFALK